MRTGGWDETPLWGSRSITQSLNIPESNVHVFCRSTLNYTIAVLPLLVIESFLISSLLVDCDVGDFPTLSLLRRSGLPLACEQCIALMSSWGWWNRPTAFFSSLNVKTLHSQMLPNNQHMA